MTTPQNPPPPFELWNQANGDRQRYHDLMVEHGHILRPGDEGYEDGSRTFVCEDGGPARASTGVRGISTIDKARALLGKQVRVKLDEQVVTEGQLLGWSDGGEVEVLEADGFVHHCWPMLEIEPLEAS